MFDVIDHAIRWPAAREDRRLCLRPASRLARPHVALKTHKQACAAAHVEILLWLLFDNLNLASPYTLPVNLPRYSEQRFYLIDSVFGSHENDWFSVSTRNKSSHEIANKKMCTHNISQCAVTSHRYTCMWIHATPCMHLCTLCVKEFVYEASHSVSLCHSCSLIKAHGELPLIKAVWWLLVTAKHTHVRAHTHIHFVTNTETHIACGPEYNEFLLGVCGS